MNSGGHEVLSRLPRDEVCDVAAEPGEGIAGGNFNSVNQNARGIDDVIESCRSAIGAGLTNPDVTGLIRARGACDEGRRELGKIRKLDLPGRNGDRSSLARCA